MSEKIGLIQTGGIGDIIIALPIADYYEEQGFEVYWPIDSRFFEMFKRIKPSVNFFPIAGTAADGADFFLHWPLQVLGKVECRRNIILYNYLGYMEICDTRLTASMKFDEYKYAIAGVSFDRKWSLTYERDMAREEALYEDLSITEPYICIHEEGSDIKVSIPLSTEIMENYRVIRVDGRTDSPFDWLLTLERASKLMMIDSCFSNLVEQMNLPNEKLLYLRSPISHTPVYKNGWKFRSVTSIRGDS